jgi:hypothetical protein
LNPPPSRRLRASIVFPNRPPFESSMTTRSEMTKSPSSGRTRPRAVPELIPCRCGVLFPARNGKRFCSKRCQGQHVVETRQLVGRHLNVPPLPPDEMAFVIDDGGRRLIAPRKMHIDDQRWRVALTEPEARELGSSGPVWPGATD